MFEWCNTNKLALPEITHRPQETYPSICLLLWVKVAELWSLPWAGPAGLHQWFPGTFALRFGGGSQQGTKTRDSEMIAEPKHDKCPSGRWSKNYYFVGEKHPSKTSHLYFLCGVWESVISLISMQISVNVSNTKEVCYWSSRGKNKD